MAERSFKAIDQNNDGYLSIDEFVNVAIDFLYSEDENSIGKEFFGVLVDELPDSVKRLSQKAKDEAMEQSQDNMTGGRKAKKSTKIRMLQSHDSQ